MNRYLYVLFLFCGLFATGQHQQSNASLVEVTGTVLETDSRLPLEYATIVFTPVNGKTISGGITDKYGKFNIKIPRGSYNITVEFISFKTKTFKKQHIQEKTSLGTILLASNTEALDAVEVIAEKSTVEIRLDKKIYNVGKDMTVKGGTASDVLDNVPSVSVDVEGNVSLRGNDNVRILVNGKPSGLVGISGTDALRQLPAEAIEKVEVITSPSARYDAEGTAGILNIILRKGKAQGFNGSGTLSVGDPDNLGASANLNFRTKKINYFGNLGYSYRNSPGNSMADVTYFDDLGDVSFYRNQDVDYDRERKGLNGRIGLEYFLGKKGSISSSVLYRKSDGDDKTTNNISILDASKIKTGTSTRIETEQETDNVFEYNLNYSQEFKKSGHTLSLDFQYENSEEFENGYISDENPEQNATDEANTEYQLKGDYVLPFGEDAQFEFGFNFNFDKLDTDYRVEFLEDGIFVNNSNFSNTLHFEQDVYAVYSQYGQKYGKFSFLAGLRAEKTDRTIDLKQSESVYKKDFTELFPTLNLGLELSDDESITMGYSRRLRRPRHWFLNPFESRTSETYIRKGNVNLDPTYTNSFEIGYLKKWDKITLNSSVYYQHSINNFEMVQEEELRTINDEELLVIIRYPINLSTQDRYGLEFNTNYSPFKWWRISNSMNFYSYKSEGKFAEKTYNTEDFTWMTRLTSRISLPANIDWQTRAFYMAPSDRAFSKRDAMLSLSMAFSKDILKEKGTLSLNISDLFNTRKHSGETFSESTYTKSEFQYRMRQVLLNFTYRFNQKKQRARGNQNHGGNGEEEMFQS